MSDTPRKPAKTRSQPARAAGSGRFVVHGNGGGWEVRGERGQSRVYETQSEAVKAARSLVQSKGGELRIQGPNGRIRQAYTIGRDPFLKISAVEGIIPTKAAQHRTKDFDQRGLSPDERREAIIQAHRPRKG